MTTNPTTTATTIDVTPDHIARALTASALYAGPDDRPHLTVTYITEATADQLTLMTTDSYAALTLTVPARVSHPEQLTGATLPARALLDVVKLARKQHRNAGTLTLSIDAAGYTIHAASQPVGTIGATTSHQMPNLAAIRSRIDTSITTYAPQNYGAAQLLRIGKTGKALGDDVTAIRMAGQHTTETGEPNPNGPALFTVEADGLTAEIIQMPQRR
jgi:hypothetical protein